LLSGRVVAAAYVAVACLADGRLPPRESLQRPRTAAGETLRGRSWHRRYTSARQWTWAPGRWSASR